LGALAEAGARDPVAWRAAILDAAGTARADGAAPPEVRAAALRALGALADPVLAPLFARGLADAADEVSEAAAGALARLGAAALPVVLVAARFGSRRARDAALEVVRDLDAGPAACDDLIERELEELGATLARRAAATALGSPAGRLFALRLGERAGEIRRTLALVVEVRVGDRRIGRAAEGLGGDARARARALESLDALLSRPLAARVVPALEDGAEVVPTDLDDALRAELGGTDPLARLLAVHALPPKDRGRLREAIRAAASAGATSADPVRLLTRLTNPEDPDVPRSVETMVFLKEIHIFSELEPSQLAELAAVCAWETLGAGDHLEPDGLVVVASGRLGEHGPGAVVGAGALFGDPAPGPLEATEKSRVLTLARADFARAVDDLPAIGLAICRVLHRRQAEPPRAPFSP
jgi:hypothetical protein